MADSEKTTEPATGATIPGKTENEHVHVNGMVDCPACAAEKPTWIEELENMSVDDLQNVKSALEGDVGRLLREADVKPTATLEQLRVVARILTQRKAQNARTPVAMAWNYVTSRDGLEYDLTNARYAPKEAIKLIVDAASVGLEGLCGWCGEADEHETYGHTYDDSGKRVCIAEPQTRSGTV